LPTTTRLSSAAANAAIALCGQRLILLQTCNVNLRRVTGRTSPSLDFDGWCGGHPTTNEPDSHSTGFGAMARLRCICGKRCWRSPQSLRWCCGCSATGLSVESSLSVDDTNRGKLFLETHQVKFVLAQFVDIHGTAKTKAVPLHFEDILDRCWLRGFRGLGTGMQPNSPDFMAVGDPSTLSLVPWMPGFAHGLRWACSRDYDTRFVLLPD